ncbi:pyridoxamine 5'-phosphate oxidase family protein [Undibacterium sp.]|uniref:pyridoxamine 5'-phosphate oxidase family protein n=1 Tax=Undibacterium sp. TaxID=1914977 RepID=UPI0025DF253B|nr:pyridoxamine 5'-phosphate oxidase family protein [Undibacterium sp.]
MPNSNQHLITTPAQLASLFGDVAAPSLSKEVAYLHPHYQAMIAASPFAVLATAGADGLDVSPRGDAAGFVLVQDQHTLLLPERKGNNRVDSLRNLLADPRMALLFLIPGVGETLRVNGRAAISVDPALLERCAVDGKAPKCVLVISVETVYFQCVRAIYRSGLWQNTPPSASLPSPGTILEALSEAHIQAEVYDQGLRARQQASLY